MGFHVAQPRFFDPKKIFIEKIFYASYDITSKTTSEGDFFRRWTPVDEPRWEFHGRRMTKKVLLDV